MKVTNKNGHSTRYPNHTVKSITFPRAIECLSAEDCAGNGVSPNEVILLIAFNDGTAASFIARNWSITEI